MTKPNSQLPEELRESIKGIIPTLPLEAAGHTLQNQQLAPTPEQQAIVQNITNLNLSFAAQVRNFNIQIRVAIDHKQLFPQFAHQIADELIEIVQLLRDAIAKVQI